MPLWHTLMHQWFDAIQTPAYIKTFKIDDSTYAGIFSTDSDYFTIINITDPSSPSQVSVLDSTVNSTFDLTKIDYTVIDGSTYLISTSRGNDGVLIINVNNPSVPSLVSYVTDGAEYTALETHTMLPP